MSSRRGGGAGSKFTSGGATGSFKGKNVQVSSDQLANSVAGISLESEQEGVWETGRNRRNRNARKAASQNSNARVLGNFRTGTGEIRMHAGRTNAQNQSSYRGCENNYSQPEVTPQRSYKSVAAKEDSISASRPVIVISVKEEDKDDDEDSDNDIYDSDEEYDTDESQKSHETRKKNRLFKEFFENLDKMNLDEIEERHCPACKNGPGAIFWYKGLQPLLNHAKTIRKGKVNVHREFAELLEEELRIRGTSVIPAGVAFGKWRGLKENLVKDKEIVWPPMVIIRNTLLEQDDNGKWLGMGNAELLEYFSAFEAVSSKHSYGPQGHRGMSLLIFESSAIGFIEADQLSEHFEDEGIGKEAWARCQHSFIPGGQRQLYGYMAEKKDMDIFNQHSHDKPMQKFEMKSYQEMVIRQLKQMSMENHLLLWHKNKVENLKRDVVVLKLSNEEVKKKMRKVSEEHDVMRQRTELYHKEINEEIDEMEKFQENKFKLVHDDRKKMEEKLEKMQKEREEKKQYLDRPSAEDRQSRIEIVTTSISSQNKDAHIYAEERSKLLKDQEQRMSELKRQQNAEKVKLEEEFNAEFVQLMEKHKHLT